MGKSSPATINDRGAWFGCPHVGDRTWRLAPPVRSGQPTRQRSAANHPWPMGGIQLLL